MRRRSLLVGACLAAALPQTAPAAESMLLWGVEVEQLEARHGESDANLFAWSFDAMAGGDELKAIWRSEGELTTGTRTFERLENQLRLQWPVSTFFDAAAGIRVDTPRGRDRTYGVIGIKGLAPQWLQVDADLYVADDPVFRLEVEYEGLITNRLILIPSLELDLPLAGDEPVGLGAFDPRLEVGARLGYDLVDRLLSPYLGVHYERAWGKTADLRREEGEDDETLYLVIGLRMLF